MIHLLLFFLASTGFAMLCLARGRHQRDLVGRTLSGGVSGRIRAAGWAIFLLAFVLAGRGVGWGYGVVEWFGLLSAGALVTVVILTYLSGRKPPSR